MCKQKSNKIEGTSLKETFQTNKTRELMICKFSQHNLNLTLAEEQKMFI